jgi:hypothetical protein
VIEPEVWELILKLCSSKHHSETVWWCFCPVCEKRIDLPSDWKGGDVPHECKVTLQ